MTREEVIRILDPETRRETMKQVPVFERIATDQEACRLAVAALRAQQEPVKLDRSRWGWEKCMKCVPEYVHMDCDTCFYAARREELEPCKSCVKAYQDSDGEDTPWHVTANYCSHCGRPLTEDAWAELERRINGETAKD